MEVKGTIQKDKSGKPFVMVTLTAENIDIIQEALAKTIQETNHPDESNIKKMEILESEFLKLRDKVKPS